MNQQQRNYLSARVDAVYTPTVPACPESAEVKAAKRVLKEHEDMKDKIRSKHFAEFNASKKAVRETIVFGDADTAIAAVEEFEAKWAQKQ